MLGNGLRGKVPDFLSRAGRGIAVAGDSLTPVAGMWQLLPTALLLLGKSESPRRETLRMLGIRPGLGPSHTWSPGLSTWDRRRERAALPLIGEPSGRGRAVSPLHPLALSFLVCKSVWARQSLSPVSSIVTSQGPSLRRFISALSRDSG